MCEIFRKKTENEKETISGVRDDEIRKNGMGMPAAADQAQDTKFMAYREAAHKVYQ